jgi:hypothetical protein
MTVSIHVLIFLSIENNYCSVYGIYGKVFSIYSIIFTGLIPISAMIFFGIMLLNALRQSRFRVQPLENTRRLNRRDINLMKLVLAEVIVYIICTFGYPLMYLYLNITNGIILDKSTERKQIESFINFITMAFLLYLNYNTTFYIHICTSKTYRIEVKQFILKIIKKTRNIEQIEENELGVVNQMRA